MRYLTILTVLLFIINIELEAATRKSLIISGLLTIAGYAAVVEGGRTVREPSADAYSWQLYEVGGGWQEYRWTASPSWTVRQNNEALLIAGSIAMLTGGVCLIWCCNHPVVGYEHKF